MNDQVYRYDGFVFDQAEGEFETLHEFLSTCAEHLRKEHSDYVDFHGKQQQTHPLILDDLYNEDYIDFYLSNLGKYGQTFPRMLLYSFMLIACSLFEANMKLVYKVMNHFGVSGLQWDIIPGTVIKKAIKILKDINLYSDEQNVRINEIRNYFLIRNCIVHDNGEIQHFRQRKKLLPYATQHELVSDSYDEPVLQLNIDYCYQACDTFTFFFSDLSINYPERQH